MMMMKRKRKATPEAHVRFRFILSKGDFRGNTKPSGTSNTSDVSLSSFVGVCPSEDVRLKTSNGSARTSSVSRSPSSSPSPSPTAVTQEISETR